MLSANSHLDSKRTENGRISFIVTWKGAVPKNEAGRAVWTNPSLKVKQVKVEFRWFNS